MKLLRYLLPLMVAVGFTSTSAYGYHNNEQDGSNFNEELNERDFDALRNFVNTKRTLDISAKSCNLTISGDVRTEWRHLTEKIDGRKVRGGGAIDWDGLPISRNDFDIEFNLRFDYVADCTWAVAHLQFDNTAGVDDTGLACSDDFAVFIGEDNILVRGEVLRRGDPVGWHGSGECDDLCLKKAYFGYNLCNECGSRFDIEVGRRNLYNVFDSKVQFLSRFDGLLLRYTSNWECVADWYWYLAGFVVDERVNHYAWATELGFLNICDSCVDFKYSFIHWRKNGRNRCLQSDPEAFHFLNSQFTVYYHFDAEMLCAPAEIYGAVVWNHDAPKHRRSNNKRKNYAWYVGFEVGEVRCEGDWAFEVQYQYVQAQAVPEYDVSGIGRGNVLNETLTQIGRGNANYKGWRFEALYALTDNLTLDTIVEWSTAVNRDIGGRHSYSKFELEAIYAF